MATFLQRCRNRATPSCILSTSLILTQTIATFRTMNMCMAMWLELSCTDEGCLTLLFSLLFSQNDMPSLCNAATSSGMMGRWRTRARHSITLDLLAFRLRHSTELPLVRALPSGRGGLPPTSSVRVEQYLGPWCRGTRYAPPTLPALTAHTARICAACLHPPPWRAILPLPGRYPDLPLQLPPGAHCRAVFCHHPTLATILPFADLALYRCRGGLPAFHLPLYLLHRRCATLPFPARAPTSPHRHAAYLCPTPPPPHPTHPPHLTFPPAAYRLSAPFRPSDLYSSPGITCICAFIMFGRRTYYKFTDPYAKHGPS